MLAGFGDRLPVRGRSRSASTRRTLARSRGQRRRPALRTRPRTRPAGPSWSRRRRARASPSAAARRRPSGGRVIARPAENTVGGPSASTAARVAVSGSTASGPRPPARPPVRVTTVPGPRRFRLRASRGRRDLWDAAGSVDAAVPPQGPGTARVALRTALTEAAHTATRTNNTYLAAHHAHIRNRRGLPNAIGATRHDLLIADWHLMHDQVDYGDLARTAPSAAPHRAPHSPADPPTRAARRHRHSRTHRMINGPWARASPGAHLIHLSFPASTPWSSRARAPSRPACIAAGAGVGGRTVAQPLLLVARGPVAWYRASGGQPGVDHECSGVTTARSTVTRSRRAPQTRSHRANTVGSPIA